jgi:Ca2+-binding EF-hand superfamily protein
MAIRVLLVVSLVLCVSSSGYGDDAAPPKVKVKQAAPAKVKKVVPAKRIKVVATPPQARKMLLKERRALAKKLFETQQAAKEAAQILAEVEKAAAAATDPKQKAAAAAKVTDAKQKLEAARKEESKRRDELRKVVVKIQAAYSVRRYFGGTVVGVRETVDRQNPNERFMLLTSGGPVIVEVALHLDGKPYREAREALIDELLVAADTDGDGKATWEEAVQNSRFTMGRIRFPAAQLAEQFIQGFDTNKNKLVDRLEVRQFLAKYFGGPAFTLSGGGNQFYSRGGIVVLNGRTISTRRVRKADVQKLLDTDQDGVFSEQEVANAAELLKSKDADDNDLLSTEEINGTPARASRNNIRLTRTFSVTQGSQLAVLLGPTATAESSFAILTQRYKGKNGSIVAASFSAVPKLFEQLDKNSDGKLEEDEVGGMNTVKPHLQMEVHLGKTEGPKGVFLKVVSAELKKSGKAEVELPGNEIDFQADLSLRMTAVYEQTAKRYLTRYDANSNGYIEKKEMPNGLISQFNLWDADKDGKVYPKEISDMYKRQQAPYKTQVRATASSDGNALFRALDLSGDGRLSLREMKTAHVQILTLDKNKDGRIEAAEIPAVISVGFSQGNTSSSSYRRVFEDRVGSRPAASDAPKWFTRMDRNGDGDLTLREFLGTKEGFKKLDTNGDGFIELKEAKAIEKPTTSKSESEKK